MPATNTVFRIDIDESRQPVIAYGEKCLTGTIQIRDFTETFHVPVEIWSVADYKRQWKEGIERFLTGTLPSCLVTGMRDPKQGVFINTWPIHAEDDHVVLQNKILLCKQIRRRFKGRNIYDFIGPREIMTEDGEPISEWVLDRGALADFLKELEVQGPR